MANISLSHNEAPTDHEPPSKYAAKACGGARQKLSWGMQKAQSQNSQTNSKLADLLIERWAWGELSATAIQAIAHAAVSDGATHPQLTALAQVGCQGRFPANCHRDVASAMQTVATQNCLSSMRVHLKKLPNGIVSAEHKLLLPHEMFSMLYHKHRDQFQMRILGGSQSRIPEFWAGMGNHPGYLDHPVRSRANHTEMCVPLSIHSDGVPVSGLGKTWSRSVDVWSWSSILGVGNTIATNFLIYILYWKLIVKVQGMDLYHEFIQRLTWSLYWLWLGRWPTRNWKNEPMDYDLAGEPLAGGYFGTLWVIRGDLEQMNKAFGLAHHSSSSPCSLCQANTTSTPWTDPNVEEAAWKGTIWTNTSWKLANQQRHPLFQLPGVGILSYVPDIMHTLHLGAFQYTFASILKLIVSKIMPGKEDTNLEVVWVKIKNYYEAHWIAQLSGSECIHHSMRFHFCASCEHIVTNMCVIACACDKHDMCTGASRSQKQVWRPANDDVRQKLIAIPKASGKGFGNQASCWTTVGCFLRVYGQ